MASWAAWAMLSARTWAYGVMEDGKLAEFWAVIAVLFDAELEVFLESSVAPPLLVLAEFPPPTLLAIFSASGANNSMVFLEILFANTC